MISSSNKYRLYLAFYTRDYPPPPTDCVTKYDKYDLGLLFMPKDADMDSPLPVAISWTAFINRETLGYNLRAEKVRSRPATLAGLVYLDKVPEPDKAKEIFKNFRWNRMVGCHDWVIQAIKELVATGVVTNDNVKAVTPEKILETGFYLTVSKQMWLLPRHVPACDVNGHAIKSALEGF
ncbi:hypothetical protein CC1G_13996 [Coprinopsis cinerea okayama7|uniref:Uncharacterized protein n=1 Tax=Coprinopsis cinerea (strain Okayama-7 / 130 / ATCC MYA-4618 / FGSC 9003) TaxID=240176 RepID=D6RL03_COPC7|nr:hypothetical protein CC1G_13996 [Coprinopsis cinerea okayama7\|eukprot:XP_002911957.1 hypothetical protein CC1G_13996 [Coprinopsis cinerea okayama7\